MKTEAVRIAKNAETLVKFDKPIKRADHKGYLIYLYGETAGDGLITRICRSKMEHGGRKKKE